MVDFYETHEHDFTSESNYLEKHGLPTFHQFGKEFDEKSLDVKDFVLPLPTDYKKVSLD
jgi:hypothetical protein